MLYRSYLLPKIQFKTPSLLWLNNARVSLPHISLYLLFNASNVRSSLHISLMSSTAFLYIFSQMQF